MKKSLLVILSALLIVPFVLCACGQKQETPSTPETKEPVTVAPQPAEPETSEKPSEPEPSKEEANEKDLVEVTKGLMDRVRILQYVDAAALDVDSNTSYTDENGYKYNLVTDPDFQSFGDIINYLTDTFTTSGADKQFPYLVNPDQMTPPAYLYLNDDTVPEGLYMIEAAKGFPVYMIDSDVEILDADDDSFAAEFNYDDFGRTMILHVEIVKEDGAWKVDSMTSIEP